MNELLLSAYCIAYPCILNAASQSPQWLRKPESLVERQERSIKKTTSDLLICHVCLK